MQENKLTKIIILIIGAASFITKQDVVAASMFLSSMVFYVTLCHLEQKKVNESDKFLEDLKKLKDRVDSMAIQKAFK